MPWRGPGPSDEDIIEAAVERVLDRRSDELAKARATLERVRLAGRAIVLKSTHGRTIIHDAGIMQEDAVKVAEALRGSELIEDLETEEDIYLEVGFLTKKDIDA